MPSALTIGNFDGVHRGHRALVDSITRWKHAQPQPTSDQDRVRTVVVTFDPHPVEVLRPGTFVPRLSTPSEKTRRLEQLGVDDVITLPFTPEFARVPARQFFEQFLLAQQDLAYLAIGHNFCFGHAREGTPERLIEWCRERQIPAHLVDAVEADGAPVSSSRIRELIAKGQMVGAARLLGRDYALTSEVQHGDKRGRQLGFPTANLILPGQGPGARALPAKGVYLSSSTVEGKTFASITNVGVKPTVQPQGPLTIETHLLDFEGDLYGKQLTVEFRDRLRDEKRFNGLDELKQQIHTDVQLAKARLTHS